MGKLDNKIVVITGATSGIGRGIAEVFAAEGAAVVIAGRDESAGRKVVHKISDSGGTARYIWTDVTSPEAVEHLVEESVNEFGRIDGLIPNAGILGLGSVTEVSLETWYNTIDVNLNGVFYLMRYGIPEMQKRNGGSIVVTGSIGSQKGFPNHAAYCASKGSLPALVKQAAVDYAPDIRVNLIQPGPTDTNLYEDSRFAFPNPDTILDEVPEDLPMNRIGSPDDIAKAALFLASDDASWITGSILTVDGGASAAG